MASAGRKKTGAPAGALGLHWLVEASGCDARRLKSPGRMEDLVLAACRAARFTVMTSHFFRWEGGGSTGVAVLSESHLSLHTWPEHRFCAIDLFLCGPSRRQMDRAVRTLLEGLRAKAWKVAEVHRGVADAKARGQVIVSWHGPPGG